MRQADRHRLLGDCGQSELPFLNFPQLINNFSVEHNFQLFAENLPTPVFFSKIFEKKKKAFWAAKTL